MTGAPGENDSVAAAKARLLVWADDHDVRAREVRKGLGAVAVGGAVAVIGGLVIARLLSARQKGKDPSAEPRRFGQRFLTWAMVVAMRKWLLPWAISAIENKGAVQQPSQREA